MPAPNDAYALTRRALLGSLAAALVARPLRAAPKLEELRLDYAYYSPSSLVLRRFGWLEDDFGRDGVKVKWVLSAGSNRALEYLNSGSIDIGSSAGLAALLARANGNPIRTPYLFSHPEWTALVVGKDSPVKSIAELKGKKVAATPGTDPYLFLLRALRTAGLTRKDIEFVPLQHADGRVALEQGRVDAWAGLDPLMAASELDAGSRLIYRNTAFNSYGFLDVREAFLAEQPEALRRVIANYERARLWIIANVPEAAKIVSEEAKVSLPVALLQLRVRTDLRQSTPTAANVQALRDAAPILQQEQLVKSGTDLDKAITDLVDTRFGSVPAAKG